MAMVFQYFFLLVLTVLCVVLFIVLFAAFIGLWYNILKKNAKTWEEINEFNNNSENKCNVQKYYNLSILSAIIIFMFAISFMMSFITTQNILYLFGSLILLFAIPYFYFVSLERIKEYFRSKIWKMQAGISHKFKNNDK